MKKEYKYCVTCGKELVKIVVEATDDKFREFHNGRGFVPPVTRYNEYTGKVNTVTYQYCPSSEWNDNNHQVLRVKNQRSKNS